MSEVTGSSERWDVLPSHRTCYDVGDRIVAPANVGDGVGALEAVEGSDVVGEATTIYNALCLPHSADFTFL